MPPETATAPNPSAPPAPPAATAGESGEPGSSFAWLREAADRVADVATRRDVYHVGFWCVAAAVLFYVERPVDSHEKVTAVVTSLGFYAAIVYFNLNYLLPSYLTAKRVGVYLLLFVTAALVATPLRALVLYWIYDGHPGVQRGVMAAQGGIFLTHVAAGCSSTMLKIAADWTRNQRERQRLEAENLASELNFLRSQVNPHFLFNTLNSLYALTLKKSDEAPETVLKLSGMMRYMLYESNATLVPLRAEVDYLRNYLALERLRHGASADVRFDVDGEVGGQRIAPMLFIPFVENAFKHGMAKVLGEGFVHIVLLVEGGEARFHLENAKPAVDLDDGRPGGIGLINVQRRLELLYPEAYELHTLVTDDTYSVDLYLDLDAVVVDDHHPPTP